MKKIVIFCLIFWAAMPVFAQKHTLSGLIKDASTGEELIGANVYVVENKTGTISNAYGFYSITLPKGKYEISFSFLGYQSQRIEVDLTKDHKRNIELVPSEKSLQEVRVEGERKDVNVRKVEMSTVKLQMKSVRKLPALLGEVDVIKSLQMLPGVQNGGEGSTGFYVRGGGVDQNLILLDEAPVYNAGHVGGIFSVFNGDVVKDVKLYKGGIPARYGGRLSSIVDIRMRDGNTHRFSGSGGIGILSSRLTLETPVVKDKSSFLISGRRTYVDLFFPLFNDTLIQNARVYFHDLNIKYNHIINQNNRIYVSGYLGRDVLKPSADFKMNYGNTTATVRWNHLFSQKLFSNFTFVFSNFDYNLGVPEGPQAFNWKSNIINYTLKNDYTWFLSPENTLRFGLESTFHTFKPGNTEQIGESFMNLVSLPDNYALNHAVFLSNEQKISEKLSLHYGLRFSVFQNIGKGTIYNFDQNYDVIDSTVYASGEIFQTYTNLEPRLAVRYTVGKNSSLKFSYNRTAQYIHLATNSTIATPLDVWFPSSPNIKPQKADQVALGYFQNFKQNRFESSVEVYYKKMHNAIDFKDHAQLILNPHIEGEMRIGSAYSYGLEFLLRKNVGKLTGWVSYTWSKTMREIPEINNGVAYAAPYDKTHNVAIVASYDITPRLNVAGNWVYNTAPPRTMPTGRFEYGGMIVPVYSDRNTVRIFDYHRLDLSLTIKGKKPDDKKPRRNGKERFFKQGSWTISVYNVYARKNPFSIDFEQIPGNPYITEAEMIYLFKAIPAVTYNFKF